MRLSSAVIDWIERSCRKWDQGEDPAKAFGFVVTTEMRSLRDALLRQAAATMPARWSTAQRASRIREVEKRLWPFINDRNKPECLMRGWEFDVLRAMEVAPLPSDRQLRKIVGSSQTDCQNTGCNMEAVNEE
jgi:hypothetical protein